MCGIVAAYSPAGGLTRTDLAASLAALAHRGPDGSGMWCSPSGRALLGHARLAVIDLRTGAQPITAEADALHIVTNGEFYGYEEIRRELRARGRALSTRGDSEIALHLYALDGLASLTRLRGEFAFVIWDERRGELIAVRDRFGIKPLYYAEHGGRVYLASEIKALLAAGVPARWDVDAFADHLQLAIPSGRTFFAGVRQLPPGSWLVAGEHGIRVRCYWDLDYPRQGQADPAVAGDGRARAEYVAGVERAVADAVLVRTHADVPVSYHLSGGLDSSTVVAVASRHAAVSAFTVGFDDADYDESAVARRTAAFLGVDHYELSCRRADLASNIVAVVRAGEMIQENAHGVARYLHSAEIRRRGFTVVLAGEGGDELFAGYPQLQKDLLLTRSPDARAYARAGYAKLDAIGAPAHLRSLLGALGLIPTWVLDRYMSVTSPMMALLRDDFADVLSHRDASAEVLAGASGQLDERAFIHQSMYLFIKTWLCGYILAAERLDMAHALEVRLPMLDHHLFETVRATPIDWYAHGGQTKFPLRAAMRGYLPAEVSEGPKRGFFAPPTLTDDATLAVLRELADAGRDNPFFDPAKVGRMFDRLAVSGPAERARAERLVQIVAGTCVLGREFSVRSP